MKFHHNTLPPSNLVVLAAWTNGDEFHVLQSAWDGDKKEWNDSEGFGAVNGLAVYAWAEWPEAPPLRQDRTRMFISRLFKRIGGPQWRTCCMCDISEWVRGWRDDDFYACSDECLDKWNEISF